MNKAEAIKILDANRKPYGQHDSATERALAEFIDCGEVSLEGWSHFYSGMNQTLHAAIIHSPLIGMFVIVTWPDYASDNNEALADALFCYELQCSPREEYVYEKPYKQINLNGENDLRQRVENLFLINGFNIVWENPDGIVRDCRDDDMAPERLTRLLQEVTEKEQKRAEYYGTPVETVNASVSILKCQFDSFSEFKNWAYPPSQLAAACFAYPAYIDWFKRRNMTGEPMDIWTFANSDTFALIATQKARAYNDGAIIELLQFMAGIDRDTIAMLDMLSFVSAFDYDDDDEKD